jgi:hypothetical protein
MLIFIMHKLKQLYNKHQNKQFLMITKYLSAVHI